MIIWKSTLVGLAIATASLEAHAGLTLSQYIEQVKTRNPEARAAFQNVESLQYRQVEAEGDFVPVGYINYGLVDDQKQNAQPTFMGTRTRSSQWQVGVQKNTTFGLSGNLYFEQRQINLEGVDTNFVREPDVVEARGILELRQSLWRNSFGEVTRSENRARKAALEASLAGARFQVKTLMVQAENLYWKVVTYNQIVRLQEENLARAKKLYDWMRQRASMRLFDDVEAMQAQVAYESRQLELQQSQDQRETIIRQFNTLRGNPTDTLAPEDGALEEIPKENLVAEVKAAKSGRVTREDYEMLRKQATAELNRARALASKVRPQFDLVGSFAHNGRDPSRSEALSEMESGDYPTWMIGFNFSMALDIGLIHNVKRGYKLAQKAADNQVQQVDFQEERAWHDLNKQRVAAQSRFERALNVEKIQTELVKRERQRLMNGRSTTFQALNFEQGLALAQIQRVRMQLDLLEMHNMVKTFQSADGANAAGQGASL